MSFVYPWVLFLLFLTILFYGAKKYSKLEQVFSKDILAKLQIGTFGSKSMKAYFLVAAFVLLVIALARPVVPLGEKIEVNQKSFNFVIALDISKSMEATDVFPTRLKFAKKAIYSLMDRVPEANIAVIAYANDAFLVSPFSNDFKSIKFLLENLNPDSLSSKGSQILSALESANRLFESTNETKRPVLLVSDGADGRGIDKIEEYIKKHNILLHVLSIGTKKGTTLRSDDGGLIKDKNGNIVVSKRSDELSKILNGGAYLSSSGELTKLDWLAKQIKSSATLKDEKRDKFDGARELFYYPLAVSILLLFFAFNTIRVPFLLILLFVRVDVNAGIFDFIDIYNANKSYENREYKKAEESFSKLDDQKAKYNKANALYKQKKYKEALKEYEKINSFSGEDEHMRLHNLGNTYVNLGKIDKAIQSYKKALKIRDDEDTKENLKLLEQKKKKQQKQKQQKKNGDKNQKDKKKKQKNDKKSDGKQKNKDSKKGDKKEKKKSSKGEQKKQGKDKKKQQKKEGKAQKQKKDRKMSQAELKKWEKLMNNQKFKTRPMKLKKGEKNEIYW